MAALTALGRVQPIYKGEYNPSTIYHRLDNVYYEGNTYLCKVDSVVGVTPAEISNYWQLVAHKGDQGIQGVTGSFGTHNVGTVNMIDSDEPAEVTITPDPASPDTAKNFIFEFDIPKGPKGFDSVDAETISLSAGSPPTVDVSLEPQLDETTELKFTFGIPAASGEGIKKLDNDDTLTPDTQGNLNYNGVRYTTSQTLSPAQKIIARSNIGAQEAGDYIVKPSQASSGQFLQYSNEGEWEAATINIIPTGSSSDVGKYLRKTNNGMLWADVQSLPAGGAEGAPLIKNSADNYDVAWGSFISSSEIDDIINA